MSAQTIPRDLTRGDVLGAIEAFATGVVPHQFHDSDKYDLIHAGGRYPPKAILGIAARRLVGRALLPSEFSGGEGSACFRILRELGFEIALKPEFLGGGDWTDPEIDAAVGAYLEMLRREITGAPFSKAEINRQLRATRLVSRTKSSVEYRMQNISAVLRQAGRRWLSGYRPAENVGANVGAKILASLNRLGAVTQSDSRPEADHDALEARVRGNRFVPALRMPEGNKAPRKITRGAEQFERDPAVIAWVRDQAKGKCECCESPAPFKDDYGFAFLEVHHLVPLSMGGEDTVKNAVALCPNCHRRCHHSSDRIAVTERLLQKVSVRAEPGLKT